MSRPVLPACLQGAAKTAGYVALGVAGAALLSAVAVDIADTAMLGAMAAAAGGAALSTATPKKGGKTAQASSEEGDVEMEGEEGGTSAAPMRVTGAGEPGLIIAAGLASAFDAGQALVRALDGSSDGEEMPEKEE